MLNFYLQEWGQAHRLTPTFIIEPIRIGMLALGKHWDYKIRCALQHTRHRYRSLICNILVAPTDSNENKLVSFHRTAISHTMSL